MIYLLVQRAGGGGMKQKCEFLSALLTLDCDCSCKHCYIDSQPRGQEPTLELSQWKQIISHFRRQGGREVNFHGGEPLLYPGLHQLIDHAHAVGLKTSIATNCLYISRETVETFLRCRTHVSVSLDGPQENYYRFRGVDALDQVVATVDFMLEAGVVVHPVFIVHSDNVYDLSWISDFVSARNIEAVTLSPLQPMGRAQGLADLLLSNPQLMLLLDKLEQLNQIYQGKVRFLTQSLFSPRDLYKYAASERRLKEYADDYWFVLNDGTVVADLDVPDCRRFALGNIMQGFKWNAGAYAEYKQLLDAAYQRGLESLIKGEVVNWYAVVQQVAAEQK